MAEGKVDMIHPDEKGGRFSAEDAWQKYYCRIYHHRPRTCRGFRCNLPDSSFLELFGRDSMHLLGQDRFGIPFGKAPSFNDLPPGTRD